VTTIPIISQLARDRRATGGARFATSAAGPRLATLPPLTLYVHFPWCVKKCPYCDFNSHEPRDGVAAIPESDYIDALTADLDRVVPQVWGRRVHAIFLGGGTPSLIAPAAIDRFLSAARARLAIEPDAEVTLEANPGTVDVARFAEYRALGINRLSLGVQSFDDRFLSALGRIHDGVQARRAVEVALTTFDNVNLDLMHGLPGQTEADAASDLSIARAFAPSHLSLYQLTLEANTVFAKFPPALPDDDASAAIEERVMADAAAGGWQRYEISAYARPGMQSRHNLNYWTYGDYVGIGAGAHGKISFPDRIVRQVRVRSPDVYLEKARGKEPAFDEAEVAVRELPFEFALNALRLVDGVPLARFRERTGLDATVIAGARDRAEARGLLEADPLTLRATPLGLRFLNDLQELFLPTSPVAP
jgi:putative oxygen-independent coproporphyrinogen III oxidase